MATDITLNTDKGYFDFNWTDSGDFSTDQTLDTAILMSIFCEVRAEYHEMPEERLRRGWAGNRAGFEQGSKGWLFEQERVTGSNLAELGVIIKNGLQWLADDGIADSVEVAQPTIRNGLVVVSVVFLQQGERVESKLYELWSSTGAGLNF